MNTNRNIALQEVILAKNMLIKSLEKSRKLYKYTNLTPLSNMNIATALGFFSRMCSLQSLEMLESEHDLVTALSVESWPGPLQTTKKHIRG